MNLASIRKDGKWQIWMAQVILASHENEVIAARRAMAVIIAAHEECAKLITDAARRELEVPRGTFQPTGTGIVPDKVPDLPSGVT